MPQGDKVRAHVVFCVTCLKLAQSPFLPESTASCGRSNQKRAHNNQRSRFGKEPHFYSDYPAASVLLLLCCDEGSAVPTVQGSGGGERRVTHESAGALNRPNQWRQRGSDLSGGVRGSALCIIPASHDSQRACLARRAQAGHATPCHATEHRHAAASDKGTGTAEARRAISGNSGRSKKTVRPSQPRRGWWTGPRGSGGPGGAPRRTAS